MYNFSLKVRKIKINILFLDRGKVHFFSFGLIYYNNANNVQINKLISMYKFMIQRFDEAYIFIILILVTSINYSKKTPFLPFILKRYSFPFIFLSCNLLTSQKINIGFVQRFVRNTTIFIYIFRLYLLFNMLHIIKLIKVYNNKTMLLCSRKIKD